MTRARHEPRGETRPIRAVRVGKRRQSHVPKKCSRAVSTEDTPKRKSHKRNANRDVRLLEAKSAGIRMTLQPIATDDPLVRSAYDPFGSKLRVHPLPATSGLPNNGHQQTGSVGPVGAKMRHCTALFDDLVRLCEQCWRNREAEGPQVQPIQTRLARTRSDPMSSCGLPIQLSRPVGGVG